MIVMVDGLRMGRPLLKTPVIVAFFTAKGTNHVNAAGFLRRQPPHPALISGFASGSDRAAASHIRASASRGVAVVERRPDKNIDPRFCRAGHDARWALLRACRPAHRDLRQ